MKQLFTILSILFLASCSAPKIIHSTFVGYVDYSEYAEKGFFITESNSVSFEYVAIGSVYAEMNSGHKVLGYKEEIVTSFGDNYKVTETTIGDWIDVTVNDAIEALYGKVIGEGGDGIIGLKTGSIPAEYDKSGKIISPRKIWASGMAIKR